MHSTIGSTVHSMLLNSLEHCICTTTMTNIRPDRDSNLVPPCYKPQSIRMSHRGRLWGNGLHIPSIGHMRKVNLKDVLNFGQIIERTMDITNVISPQASRREFVFDSPEDGFIKDFKIMRRTDAEKPPIGLEEIKKITRHYLKTWSTSDQCTNEKIHVLYSCMSKACIRKWKPHGDHSC